MFFRKRYRAERITELEEESISSMPVGVKVWKRREEIHPVTILVSKSLQMSSDIDEEEDYSSIDERDPKMQQPHQQQHGFLPPRVRQQQQLQQLHQLQQLQQQQPQLEDALVVGGNGMSDDGSGASAYVNLGDPKLSLDLNGGPDGSNSLKSATRRDKAR